MRRPGSARRVLRAPAVAIAGLAVVVLASPTAGSAATPGVWGVGQTAYVDGTVCTVGNTTSPLVSWNFGDPSVDFLLTSVTSNGISDSALLPQSGTPGRQVAPISAGQFGFGPSDIATFAALISLFGSGPDPDAAETASAILQTTDGGAVPDCISPTAALDLKAAAARLAGPYTVTVTPASAIAPAGGSSSVSVRVTNSIGQGVPNTAVGLSSTAPLFDGLTTTTGRTDASGVAKVAFTAPQDSTLTSATITATAAVSVGLEGVTVDSGFGQHYASAVYADPPTVYQGAVTIPISQGAMPVLTSKLSATAITTGATLSLAVQLTGMFGHAGQAAFTIAGPLKLDPTTLCAGDTAKSFASTGTAAHSSVDVVGDSALTGGQWQPTSPGCYLVSSTVVTTNATPQASARGPQTVITVLDTVAAATPDHTVIGPSGTVATSVAITHSYARPGVVATSVVGPIDPGNGDCTGADWSKAPTVVVPSTKTTGDGTYQIATGALAKTGCYQLHSTLQLTVSGSAKATVPLTFTGASNMIYVLQPTVSAAADVTSVASPAPVRTTVTVQNTFGQPGHVTLQMYLEPDDHFACRRVDFTHAPISGTGAPVPITGDGTVTVNSGATPKLGCYALVPKLVMDENSAVVATGSPSGSDTILAGVGLAPPVPRAAEKVSRSLLSTWITLGVSLALLFATSFGVIRYVQRTYQNDGDGDEDDRPSPLGARFGGLFTDRA